MPHSAVSDLGLHWLPITLLEVSRLKWINYPIYTAALLFFVSCIFFENCSTFVYHLQEKGKTCTDSFLDALDVLHR